MTKKSLIIISTAGLIVIVAALATLYADGLGARLIRSARQSLGRANNNPIVGVIHGAIYHMRGNCIPRFSRDESENSLGVFKPNQVGKSALTGPCTNEPLANKDIELRELPPEGKEITGCRDTPLVASGQTDGAGAYSFRVPLGNNNGEYALVFDYPLPGRENFCYSALVHGGLNERITVRAGASF